MSVFAIGLIIVVNFIFQSTILPYFNIFDVVPNTSLILIVIISLLKGKKTGSLIGLIIGLLQDIIFSPVIGINGFIYFFVGYLIGMIENKLSKDNVLIPFIMTMGATVGYHLLYYVFMYFLAYNISFYSFFRKVVVIEMICNSLLSLVIYKWFSRKFVTPFMSFKRR
ncbi:MAG: rod shape-determining protein MreD [Tissierellia bacterium]|nr:rod shape-determining protein MreD [Tissierellia bacterium]